MARDLDDALQAALRPDERILWSDRPHGFVRVLLGPDRLGMVAILGVALLALSPLGVLTDPVRRGELASSKLPTLALVGALTVPFGAAVLGLFVHATLGVLAQRYALTDHDRLLFVQPRGVEAVDATSLGCIEADEEASIGDVREDGERLLVAVNDPAQVAALLRARVTNPPVVVPPFRLLPGERVLWSARPAGLRGVLAALGAEEDRGARPLEALKFVLFTALGAGLCVVYPAIKALGDFVGRLVAAPHGGAVARLALMLLPSSIVLAGILFGLLDAWRWWRRCAYAITSRARLLVVDVEGLQRAFPLRLGASAEVRRGWLSGSAKVELAQSDRAAFSMQGLRDPQGVARALETLGRGSADAGT